MTPTEQDKDLRDLLEQNGWKFYEELNGFRKESKFTIPMFSTDQSRNYDTLSAGNYYEIMQLITADRKRVALEARIDELHKALDENSPFGEGQLDIASEYAEYRIAKLKAQKEKV